MTKLIRYIIGGVVIVAFLVVGFFTLLSKKIEYTNFSDAMAKPRTVEVKGAYQKDKESKYDPATSTFEFVMKDDAGTEMKVIYAGAKPNNFDVAEAVVVKGIAKDGAFHAKEILTKCPSKYEANGENIKNQ
jgi:cytochrome c-type biogenesis protein CcmE